MNEQERKKRTIKRNNRTSKRRKEHMTKRMN